MTTSEKCQNPKCGKPVTIQIRKGTESCSLDCDRELGIGKYAEQAGPFPHPMEAVKAEKIRRGKK